MNTQQNKWIVRWNIVLTVLMLASLGMNAAWVQAANDPPVRVYTATLQDNGGDGSATTVDDSITGTTPDTLVSVATANLSAAHNHICLVTASAEANWGGNGSYIFGLSMDGGAVVAESERRIEFVDTADNDSTWTEVSTTYAFTNVSGSHTFYFSARKNAAGNANMTVTASSMTLVCVKKVL